MISTALKSFFTLSLVSIAMIFSVYTGQVKAQTRRAFLDSLLKSGSDNYPLLKAKRLQTQALGEAVRYRKIGIIPILSASYQADLATYNNITGMIFPQFIRPISGPSSNSANFRAVSGSALALDLIWEPITFGQREAEINLANGSLQSGKADEILSLFNQQVYVIHAWLNYLLMQELTKVYQVASERSAFNLRLSKTLVISGLRPGTDSSSFSAENVKDSIQLIAFERRRDSSLVVLKEMAGGNFLRVLLLIPFYLCAFLPWQ